MKNRVQLRPIAIGLVGIFLIFTLFNWSMNLLQTDDFTLDDSDSQNEVNIEDQTQLLKLLNICKFNDHNEPAMLFTKNYAIFDQNDAVEYYKSSCYPIEMIISPDHRGFESCSDILMMVYYGGARAVVDFGMDVHRKHLEVCPRSTYVFVDYLNEEFLNLEQRTVWMPNVVTMERNSELLGKFSLILAKSVFAFNKFNRFFLDFKVNTPLSYHPHSAIDLLSLNAHSKLDGFLLVGDDSDISKGLLDCWQEHPDWPSLEVVSNSERLDPFSIKYAENINYYETNDFDEIQRLQKSNGVHIFTSYYESFGYLIDQSRSLGAFLIVSNEGPNSELVNDEIGFKLDVFAQGALFPVSADQMTKALVCVKIKEAIILPLEMRKLMGTFGRQLYQLDLANTKEANLHFKHEAYEYFHDRKLNGSELDELEGKAITKELDEKFAYWTN